ncbi:LysR family transcriptional regulator [Lactobacillus sp. LL6]|uniref:LysR family transcriptional regulator n=1 Tax=Lactobacillus sp. LL6 TaxID=2596827 RepID=UPI001186CF17|nr:LysR family transcriptional regulator [Lactobacillus sp. LL6]TSO25581.1 LysR family transcriptional regulator [Lactobacillus sp. LL6]
MNLNQLYYFNELAKERQFSKAAKNLCISQPSLSNSIKSLEKDLGCKLINRSGGQITLTKYGKIFFKAASSSVDILEDAKRKINRYKRQKDNIIKIISIPSAFSNYLPQTIQKFKSEISSNTTFIYQNSLSNNIYRELELGNFDIGICSGINTNYQLEFIPLYSEEIIALVKPDHPLAKLSIVTPADLKNYNIITYSQNTILGQKISQALSHESNPNNICATLDNNLSIAAHVLTNNTVGVGVDSIFLNDFNLTKIKVKVPKSTGMTYLAYNPNLELSPDLKQLINLMSKKMVNPKSD